jgi:hypothetical protein
MWSAVRPILEVLRAGESLQGETSQAERTPDDLT